MEIERHALEQIEKLRVAARDGDFTELFRLLGTSEAQRAIDADGGPAPEYTSVENTRVVAVLKADTTGYMAKHPFVNLPQRATTTLGSKTGRFEVQVKRGCAPPAVF